MSCANQGNYPAEHCCACGKGRDHSKLPLVHYAETSKDTDAVLFAVSGNARSFLNCFNSYIHNFVTPLLNNTNRSAHFYFYLKLRDPGPKGQHGFDYTYKDVDADAIVAQLRDLARQPHTLVSYRLMQEDDPTDDAIMAQVKNRSKYTQFLASDRMLVRSVQFFYNLEQVGKFLAERLWMQKWRYKDVVWTRPDLYFATKAKSLNDFRADGVVRGILNKQKRYMSKDFIALVRGPFIEQFFTKGMHILRTNNHDLYSSSEALYYGLAGRSDSFDEFLVCYYVERNASRVHNVTAERHWPCEV